jgi:hypothetical protein
MGFQFHLHPPVWQGYKTLNDVQDLVGPAPSVDGYKQDHDIFCDVFFCGFEDVEKVSSIVVRTLKVRRAIWASLRHYCAVKAQRR